MGLIKNTTRWARGSGGGEGKSASHREEGRGDLIKQKIEGPIPPGGPLLKRVRGNAQSSGIGPSGGGKEKTERSEITRQEKLTRGPRVRPRADEGDRGAGLQREGLKYGELYKRSSSHRGSKGDTEKLQG